MLSNQPEQRPSQDDLEGGPTTDRQCAAPDEALCLDEAWWFQQVSDQLHRSCSSQSARISIRKRSRPLRRQQPNPKRWCLTSGRGFATKLPRADLWRLISRPVLKAAIYTCCSMPVSARCTRAIVIPRLVQLYDAPSRTQKCLSSKTIFSLWTLPKRLMPAC